MLEAFVFVSGYVFGFQASTKYLGIVDFKMCVAKKAKRLLIPCFVFSIIYLICFGTVSNNHWDGQIYHIVNGEGHLWFLPMLFLCFVCIYFIEKLKLPTKYVLPTAVIASVLSLLSLPFRLSETAYYFLFFYLGSLLSGKSSGRLL